MKKIKPAWITVSVNPLVGSLDTRSNMTQVPLGWWRYKQNCFWKDGTTLTVRAGFPKAFTDFSPHVNQDLHDQGNATVIQPTREYPTLGFEAQNNAGQHYLYVATASRVYLLNETTGLWTMIGYGLQNLPQTRFQVAELQQVLVFTNNVNAPFATTVGTGGIAPIPDLQALGVTQAGVVVEYNGFILLMDVVENGVRQSSRIWWSDLNQPLKFGIVANSLSNRLDLDYGEQILNAVQMAGSLYVFTTRGIWRGTTTGQDAVFAFVKVYYEPQNQNACLAYRNTLVSTGNSVWYAGADGFYYFDPYIPEPERKDWLYRGSSLFFDGDTAVDPLCCQSPCAGLEPNTKEIWVSWPEKNANASGVCTNTRTIIFNYKYESVDIFDHGFSMFVNYRPSQADNAACKSAAQLFLAASTQDKCLKQIGTNYSREICTNTTNNQGKIVAGVYVPWTAIYSFEGYYSILRMLLPLVNYDRDKRIRMSLLEPHPEPSANENVVRCRIGNTFSESDPNLPDEKCSVLWHRLADKPLVCLDTIKASEYVAENLRRASGMQWPCLFSGRFLYIELTVASADGSPAIGAACSFTRLEFEIQLAQN